MHGRRGHAEPDELLRARPTRSHTRQSTSFSPSLPHQWFGLPLVSGRLGYFPCANTPPLEGRGVHAPGHIGRGKRRPIKSLLWTRTNRNEVDILLVPTYHERHSQRQSLEHAKRLSQSRAGANAVRDARLGHAEGGRKKAKKANPVLSQSRDPMNIILTSHQGRGSSLN